MSVLYITLPFHTFDTQQAASHFPYTSDSTNGVQDAHATCRRIDIYHSGNSALADSSIGESRRLSVMHSFGTSGTHATLFTPPMWLLHPGGSRTWKVYFGQLNNAISQCIMGESSVKRL